MYLKEEKESGTGRERVLSTLESGIDDVEERIAACEIKTADDEQILIKWYRTLGYLTGQYQKLTKDTDIDEMSDELELLREVTERGDEQ